MTESLDDFGYNPTIILLCDKVIRYENALKVRLLQLPEEPD